MELPRYQQSPRIRGNTHRIIDLSHELWSYPGRSPGAPPPAFPHVEPFGDKKGDVSIRTGIFRHLQVEPYSYSSGDSQVGFEIHQTSQYGLHVEGPYIGYLRGHLFGQLPAERKLVPMQSSDVPLAQLIGPASILDAPAEGEGKKVPLSVIKAQRAKLQEGDMVFIRTGQRSKTNWAYCEAGTTGWLVEEIGCRMFGTDAGGIDAPMGSSDQPEQNHHDLMLNGGCAIESGLHWENVPGDRAFVLVLPLRIHGLDAGIGRGIAIVGDERDPSGREVYDVTPVLGDTVTGKDSYSPPFQRVEPIEEKPNVARRLEILPFHVDNSFVDHAMYVTMDCRLGTHIELESPATGSMGDVSTIEPSRLIGEAVIADVRKSLGEEITARDISDQVGAVTPGEIVVIRTNYSNWYYGRSDFYDCSPGLSIEAAKWLVDKRVSMVAIDTASVEVQKPLQGVAPSGEVHSLLTRNGVLIVENLANLRYIRKKRFFFAAFPLRIQGVTICPVRAVALEWE